MTANVHFRMFFFLVCPLSSAKTPEVHSMFGYKTDYFELFLHLTLKFLKDLIRNNKEDF